MKRILWLAVGLLLLAAGPVYAFDPFTNDGLTSGLITNQYAYNNGASGVRSSVWKVPSGSLFSKSGRGWTGKPDDCAPDVDSTPCTNSARFRAVTSRKDFDNAVVSFELKNTELVSTSSTPAAPSDGAGVLLRYRDTNNFYLADLDRRDGTVTVEKKCPEGLTTIGSQSGFPIPFGQNQQVAVTVNTTETNKVTVTVQRGANIVLVATDTGQMCPPILEAGAVGFKGDNDNFTFGKLTIEPPPPPEVIVPPQPSGTVYVSPGASGCVRDDPNRPCGSFDAAYQIAHCGDQILVGAGDYSNALAGLQTFRDNGCPMGAGVTFKPAPGAVPTLHGVDIRVTHVAFENMGQTGTSTCSKCGGGVDYSGTIWVIQNGGKQDFAHGANDIVLKNLKGWAFHVIGAVQNIQVLGGHYCCHLNDHPQVSEYNPGDGVPRNVVVDGVHMDHFLRTDTNVHTECLQILAVQGFKLINSSLDYCDGTAMLGGLMSFSVGPTNSVLIENNFFGSNGDSYFSWQTNLCPTNVDIEYNTWAKGIALNTQGQPCASNGNWVFRGNYLGGTGNWQFCGFQNIQYAYNIVQGVNCGGTNKEGALQVVGNGDYHLVPGSNAQAAGDPTSCPTEDFDRQHRPQGGSVCDVGADEATTGKKGKKKEPPKRLLGASRR